MYSGKEVVIRASIKPQLLKKSLFKGTAIASSGGILLLFCGILLPKAALGSWGLIIFLVGMALIGYGLIPFRRLKLKENQPDKLIADKNEILRYYAGQKLKWEMPLKNIQSVQFEEKGDLYGLTLLDKDSNEIFLPYFTQAAQDELENLIYT